MRTEKTFNFIYAIGAAMVIIGAMGKIMHYSWSDAVLQISLIVEAGIFVMLGIQELLTKKSKEVVTLPKIEGSVDNAQLTESVDNLTKTIKQIFNR